MNTTFTKTGQRISGYLFTFLFVIFHSLFAQASAFILSADPDSLHDKHSILAARYCQEKQFDLAISEINHALEDPIESQEYFTWYTRGFIYKEIFKIEGAQNRQSQNREIAIQSFLQALKIQKDNSSIGSNNSALQFLANSIFNDALVIASTLSADSDEDGEKLYERYVEIMETIDPLFNAASTSKNFYTARAQRWYKLWTEDMCNDVLFSRTIESYEKLIQVSSDNCEAHYNLGVAWYNMAISASKDCINDEKKSASLSKATKELEQAYAYCNSNIEILMGLVNLYKMTNNQDQISKYTNILTELRKSQNKE
jgi:tetratricopeptide (TPR) repeat protein